MYAVVAGGGDGKSASSFPFLRLFESLKIVSSIELGVYVPYLILLPLLTSMVLSDLLTSVNVPLGLIMILIFLYLTSSSFCIGDSSFV